MNINKIAREGLLEGLLKDSHIELLKGDIELLECIYDEDVEALKEMCGGGKMGDYLAENLMGIVNNILTTLGDNSPSVQFFIKDYGDVNG